MQTFITYTDGFLSDILTYGFCWESRLLGFRRSGGFGFRFTRSNPKQLDDVGQSLCWLVLIFVRDRKYCFKMDFPPSFVIHQPFFHVSRANFAIKNFQTLGARGLKFIWCHTTRTTFFCNQPSQPLYPLTLPPYIPTEAATDRDNL